MLRGIAQAARRGPGANGRRVTEQPINAPIGGWNTRDPISSMQPTDAVVLDNWFPDAGELRLRPGYASHATSVGSGNVETVAALESGSVNKMIAAANGSIYDVTAAGAASSLASGFTGNRWNHAAFNERLALVNGQDTPQQYDGSTVSTLTLTGSGLTPANVIGVNVHKGRTYFWMQNSPSFWYSSLNTLGGALTEFPLSRIGTEGGNLVAMKTWTNDGGEGRDDLAVFFMSSGEVIVYAGSDPGDTASWSIVGKFKMSPIIDQRAIVQYGGDLNVLTRADVTPLSRALPNRGVILEQTKLSGAVQAAAKQYGGTTGWAGLLVPNENMMVYMYPLSSSRSVWFGYNTVTSAPFRYTGINARAFALYDHKMYFGGTDGTVYKFGDGAQSDNNANIAAEVQQAWTRLNGPGLKHVTAVRPIVSADGTISIGRGVGYDFAGVNVAESASVASAGSPWDTSDWDTSDWSPEESVSATWLPVGGGQGRFASLRLRVATKNQTVKWYATDMLVERGHGL